MKGRPTDRLVNKSGVSPMIWNDIGRAHKAGAELRYRGYRYRVVGISRLLLTNGETALAILRVVRNFL